MLLLSTLLVGCATEVPTDSAVFPTLERSNFQDTLNGKTTDLYVLQQGDLHAAITNYGGRIVALAVPDREGQLADVVLGFNSLEAYRQANEVFHGALIGRVGNRIAEGRFTLYDSTYQLPLNNGPNHLHGGPQGFHNVVWTTEAVTDTSLTLSYRSPGGEMGYPGNLSVTVTYALTRQHELTIDYQATTDQPTPVNLTNHAFFNLAGEGQGAIDNHFLQINADSFTPVDITLIPLGKQQPVAGTAFDFREGKPIGRDLGQVVWDTQLRNGQGYDHNFVLNKPQTGLMTWAATVTEPVSGRKMEIYTQEPGLQFYGGNFMDGNDIGKNGHSYAYRASFALETQHFPDSPNQKSFPSIILRPEETYRTRTVYRFGTVASK